MAQESLGYVQLIWDCTHCGSANPGPFAFCSGCGAGMPPGAAFRKAAQDVFIQDLNEIEKARGGADRYCGYCGGRNPGSAVNCTACGGDLDPAHARAAGQVVGALQTEAAPDVMCPTCGRTNPALALKCSGCGLALPGHEQAETTAVAANKRSLTPLIIFGILALAVITGVYFLFIKTTDIAGSVTEREWLAQVGILEYVSRSAEDWHDEVPEGAERVSCAPKVRSESGDPVDGAEKVCGTPYTKDLGNGYAEAVQDCVFLVKEDWCEYNYSTWEEVDRIQGSGSTLPVIWPVPQLTAGQKQGDSQVDYRVYFDSSGKKYTYSVKDENTWSTFTPGSDWSLSVNALGGVVGVDKR
jgi:hypothetical protein